MNRAKVLLTGLLCAWGMAVNVATLATEPDRPNLVFIFADDMNTYPTRDLGMAVKSPHLDALREQSILFDKANCAAPCCTPSRAAMFSGLQPHTTGVYKNGGGFWETSKPLKNCISFPELFRQSGYVTFGRGKLTHDASSKPHNQRMWSTPATGHGGFGPFPEKRFQLSGKFFSVKEWDGPDTDFPDVKSVDDAIGFLQAHSGENPFMMMIGLWRPHNPWTAPRRFFEMFDPAEIVPPPGYVEDDMTDVPPQGRAYARGFGERWDRHGPSDPVAWRRAIHGYLACTAFADWSAGRLIQALDDSPYATNTIVVFSSDNGFHLGEKHHFGKSTLWENSANVPLLIRLPGHQNAGAVCEAPVTLVDLYPTFKELCRLEEPPQALDGRSLAPLLADPRATWRTPALTCYDENMTSLRDRTWRYILYQDGSEELYNLRTDPFELTNRAKSPETQDVRDRLKRDLPATFRASCGGRE